MLRDVTINNSGTWLLLNKGARCGSVELVRLIVGSIPLSGPVALFLILASAQKLVNRAFSMYYPVLWDGTFKRSRALLVKISPPSGGIGFFS